MSKTLKLWNGRGWGSRFSPDYVDHCYVAAYSRADAVRLINESVGWDAVSDHELKEYWSGGKPDCCWGNLMSDITPERGVWIARKATGPVERIDKLSHEK